MQSSEHKFASSRECRVSQTSCDMALYINITDTVHVWSRFAWKIYANAVIWLVLHGDLCSKRTGPEQSSSALPGTCAEGVHVRDAAHQRNCYKE